MNFNKNLLLINIIYDQIVNNYAKFMEKLGIASEPVGICVFAQHMIENGFLTNNPVLLSESITQEIINLEDEYFTLDHSGWLLPFGCITCRHRANFLFSVYNNLGYKSSQIFTYDPKIKINIGSDDKSAPFTEIQNLINSYIPFFEVGKSWASQKTINGIKILIKYHAPEISESVLISGNHTLNIVLDANNQIHLLDSSLNIINYKSLDSKIIYRLEEYGFFIPTIFKKAINERIFTFKKGIELLENYDCPDTKEELRRKEYFEAECQKREADFAEFKNANSKYYDRISKSTLSLVRKVNK